MIDLHKWSLRRSRLAIGANISISDTIAILLKVAADKDDFAYCKEIAKHLDLVATVAVRNVGSVDESPKRNQIKLHKTLLTGWNDSW